MDSPLVLVVEDEFLLRMNAVSPLEEPGFGVLEAGSTDDAIALLESRRDIRIVFTDINMPGSMDGLRLAHAIRSRWPPIELVLTSGQMPVGNDDMPARGVFLGRSDVKSLYRLEKGLQGRQQSSKLAGFGLWPGRAERANMARIPRPPAEAPREPPPGSKPTPPPPMPPPREPPPGPPPATGQALVARSGS